MNGKKRRLFGRVAICALAVSTLFAAGCASDDDSLGTIAVITMTKTDDYWLTVQKGAEDAGEEIGYEIDYDAPENQVDIDVQIKLINEAIDNKAKAIVIAPSDSEKLNNALQSATDAGIPVIIIDSDVTYEGKTSFLSTNNDAAGGIAARRVQQLLPNGGKFAIVGHAEGTATAIGRINGFMNSMPDVGYELVDTKYCDNDAEKAKERTKEILEENPDISFIFATNGPSTIGVCEAVEEAGKSGKIIIMGFDSGDKQIEYIKSGVLNGIVVQNPYNMGYLGIRYADKVIDGESISASIDTGVTLVTKDNLENADVQLLLNPMEE